MSDRIRDMPWPDMRQFLRTLGPEIGRLAKRGDRLAIKLVTAYQYAHDHANDVKANQTLRRVFEEYMQRDLTDAERHDLGSKFNHRTDMPEPEGRIVVPGSFEKQ